MENDILGLDANCHMRDYRDVTIESLRKCIDSLHLVIKCRDDEIQRLRDELLNAADDPGPRQVTVPWLWDEEG